MSDNSLLGGHLSELVVGDDVVNFDDVRDLPLVDDLSCLEIHSENGVRVELTHEEHRGVLVVKHDLERETNARTRRKVSEEMRSEGEKDTRRTFEGAKL